MKSFGEPIGRQLGASLRNKTTGIYWSFTDPTTMRLKVPIGRLFFTLEDFFLVRLRTRITNHLLRQLIARHTLGDGN